MSTSVQPQRQRITREQYEAARAEGYSDDEIRAGGYEWQDTPDFSDVQSGSSSAVREPSVFEKMGVRDPAEGMRKLAQSKMAQLAAELAPGVGAGALTARALRGLAPKMFGRALVGAGSGVAGGMATRAAMEEGDLGDRAKAAVDPVGIGIDAVAGGVLGQALGVTPKATKETAKGLGKVIPRITRKGVAKDVGSLAGITPKDPKQLLGEMGDVVRQADAQRLTPLWQQFPNPITDPAVLDQWSAIRRNLPSAVDDMLAEKDLAREPLSELVQLVGQQEAPTLQGIQRLKESLDAAIKQGQTATHVGKDGKAVASRGLRALQKAREQLKNLTFQNVPGGPEYQKALAESAADRGSMSAVRQGTKAMTAASNSLNPDPTTAADVAELVAKYQAAPQPPSVPSPLDSYRSGVVGALGNTPDPLARLSNPATMEKVATAMGAPSARAVDAKIAPWEGAREVMEHLKKSGDLGLAGRFGVSEALTGGVQGAKLAGGSYGLSAISRNAALRGAAKLEDTFSTAGAPLDFDDYKALLKELYEARKRRSAPIGLTAGGLSGLIGGFDQ